MKVTELRQFLVSLASPLEGAGGRQAASDLRRAADGLGPFADMTVAAFADFLAQAHQFVQTGALPASGGRKRAPAKAVDGEAIRAAAQAYQQLYERSTDPALSDTRIDSELKALDKLSKDALIAVAREVGVQKRLPTKKEALAELRRRVVERRSTHERVRLGVDPTAAHPAGTPG